MVTEDVGFTIYQGAVKVTLTREALALILSMPHGGIANITAEGEIDLACPFMPLLVTQSFFGLAPNFSNGGWIKAADNPNDPPHLTGADMYEFMQQREPEAGDRYRHHKGRDYVVVTTAMPEAGGEMQVVYKDCRGNGPNWVRPISEFRDKFTRVD